METENNALVASLAEIIPAFTWEDISTGGGCTAIWGEHPTNGRVIMITNGDANSPESFNAEAIAIYYEDHADNEHWNAKPWTNPSPFFKLLSEIETDVQNWYEDRTPREALINRLSEWADEFESTAITYLSGESRKKFADDLRTAVYLINTHTKGN
jgi:hypothetical protein